jgi:hypothetical protein
VQQSEAFDPQASNAAAVQTVGSNRVIEINNNDGSPAVGAAVTLDGTLTRFTDASGRVTFPVSAMPAGEHTLHIVGKDGTTADITVLVQ